MFKHIIRWCIIILISFTLSEAANPTSTSALPIPTPSTIIDILSSDVQFSSFLQILQKNQLIPYINTLQNVTILAPVNLAFAGGLDHVSKDELKRYILNQKFRVGYMGQDSAVFESMYKVNNKSYPLVISPNFDTLEYEIDHVAAIVESDIYAKHQWSFIQAIDHQIPIKPSLCEVFLDNSTELNGYNISFVKGLFQLLFDTDYELDSKRDKRLKDIPTNCNEFLQNSNTALIPSDQMVQSSMSNLTMRYYSSLLHVLKSDRFSTTDEAVIEIKYDITKLLLNMLLGPVLSPNNITLGSYPSLDGAVKYNISSRGEHIIINNKLTSAYNASTVPLGDGVITVFDTEENESVPFFDVTGMSVIDMIPKKALFALHYSDFVKELEFRSLDHYIDGSSVNKTILLSLEQRDDVLDEDDMSILSFSNKDKLKYQIINEPINVTEKLSLSPVGTYYGLPETNTCSKSKIGGCYRLKVTSSINEMTGNITTTVNDNSVVVGGPYPMGNGSFAYILDDEIDTPQSFKHILADLLSNGNIPGHLDRILINQAECLKTLQYLKNFDLLSLPDNKQGYTAFLPCGINLIDGEEPIVPDLGGTWKSLGLVLNYLEQNPHIFKDVLKGIFAEDTIYSDFGLGLDANRTIVTNTMNGDTLNVSSVFFDGNYDHVFSVNGTTFHLPLDSDLIFNQGVVHIVNKLMLPTSFEISFLDLIKATEDDELLISFFDLIKQFPKLYDVLKLGDIEKLEFSMFVPTQDSLITYNITSSLPDLLQFLEAHLIPNTEVSKIFDCMFDTGFKNTSSVLPFDEFILTNNSKVSFSCKKSAHGKLVLDARSPSGDKVGHKVRIISHGCSQIHSHDGSNPCVFLIDRPLNLHWFDVNDGFLHLHLGFVSVGIGIILGLMFFCIVIFLVMFCLSGKSKSPPKNPFTPYEDSGYMGIGIDEEAHQFFDGGYETDDDMLHERDSLLPVGTQRMPPRAGSVNTDYKSTGIMSKPVSIKGAKGNTTLNRHRNLPEL